MDQYIITIRRSEVCSVNMRIRDGVLVSHKTAFFPVNTRTPSWLMLCKRKKVEQLQ